MDRIAAMQVFTKVVEAGSFARAAERLDISTSVASRQVADLEAHLQSRLLNRTTRRLSLTEAGQAFYDRAVQLLADLEEAEQAAAQNVAEPRGTIKLNAALAFGILHLAPVIDDYLARYPEVSIDVTLSDRVVDLVEEGYDLALRIAELRNPGLVARKIGVTRGVVCASPAYLKRHGTPQHPSELARHNCLLYAYAQSSDWEFREPDGTPIVVRVSGNFRSNNGNLLRETAARGVGIIREPSFQVDEDLRTGRLVRLLEGHSCWEMPMYAVYASRKHVSAKVRSFVDFLAGHFAQRSDWSQASVPHLTQSPAKNKGARDVQSKLSPKSSGKPARKRAA
jgi:DNA-binding transcriptional LysR family regulator